MTGLLGNGEGVVFTKIVVALPSITVNGFSVTTAKDAYSVAERQMLAELPGHALVPSSGAPICAITAAAAKQVQNGGGLLTIWTVNPSARFINEAGPARLAGAEAVNHYLTQLLTKSKSLYLSALKADRVPLQGNRDLDNWWGIEVRSISTTGTLMIFQVATTATTSTTIWSGVPGVSSSASKAMGPDALANLLYYTKSIAVIAKQG